MEKSCEQILWLIDPTDGGRRVRSQGMWISVGSVDETFPLRTIKSIADVILGTVYTDDVVGTS
jgi:hypothetical protein